MANMSYCRFENTLADLRDCERNMDETYDMDRREAIARKHLIELCRDIAEQFEDVDLDEELADILDEDNES